MRGIAPAIEAAAEDFPDKQRAAALKWPHITARIALAPGATGDDGLVAPTSAAVLGQPCIVAGDTAIIGVVVERERTGWRGIVGGVTRRATALQQRANVAEELHIVRASRRVGLHHGFVGGVFREQRAEAREIPRLVVGPAGKRRGNVEWTLAVRVATTAIVPHFPRADLMPRLRH